MYRTELPITKTLRYTGQKMERIKSVSSLNHLKYRILYLVNLSLSILFPALVFILYPILPVLSHLFLLMKRPSDMSSGDTNDDFMRAKKVVSFRKDVKDRQSSKNFRQSLAAARATVLSLNTATISYLKPRTTKNKNKKLLSDYQAAEYYAVFTTAISGGIESPIQFIIQVILAM